MPQSLQDLFPGGGEMASLCRAHDWAATPLGPPEEWSASLRTLVRTLLTSRHPMFLFWGPDLIQFYNDAYRPSLGAEGRHPQALGARGKAFWDDAWDVIGPQIRQVLEGGKATWAEDQLVPIYREGELQEAYWTYSYSPAFGDDGSIQGVLVITQETTDRVRSREESQALARRLSTTLESITDAFFTVDTEWRFTFLNQEAARLLERDREELLGKVLWEEFPEAVGTESDVEYHRAREEGDTVEFEQFYPPLNRWFSVNAYPSEEGLAVYFRDVTSQKMAAQRLEEGERLRRIAGRMARIGGWSVDLAAGVSHWSDEVCAIHGMPPGTTPTVDEAIDYYAPEWRPVIREVFERCAETGEPFDLDLEILDVQGRRIWVRAIGEAVRDEKGVIREVQGAFQDISRQKETEAALAEADRKFRELAESMPLVVWSADPDGAVDYLTGALMDFTGRTREGLAGEKWLEVLHPDDREGTTAAWLKSVKTGEPYEVEFRIRRHDGEYRWFLTRAHPFRDSDGEIVKWFGSSTEIHHRLEMEAEARTLAERFTSALESISDAFYLLDEEWRFTFVNSPGATLAQKSPEELLGEILWEVFPDVVGTEIEVVYRRAVEEREPETLLYHYENYGLWVEVRCYPTSEGLAISMRDVTAQQLADRKLRAAEDRFRNVVRATTDVIWDWDLEADRIWWSEGLRKTFGLDPEVRTLERGTWAQRIHPQDRDRVVSSLESAISGTDELWEEAYRFRRGDGGYDWVLDRGFVVRDETGVVRVVGGMSNETEHYESQRRLREQAQLLDRAQDAILVRDLDHTLVFWNAGAERIYGWSSEEALGRSNRDLLYTDPASYDEATRSVLETGEWMGELEHLTADGSTITVEARWSLVHDDDGTPVRILAINTDITERKRLLAQFLRAQRMESIGTLAGGIAHDLNNVLAPILLSIGLLKEDLQDPETLETLETIEVSAQRGADMVRQVLAFARGVEGDRMPVDLGRLVVDLARVVRDTFPKSVELQWEIPPDLLNAVGDPTQIHQVLMNLLVNARDAMPAGGTIRVSAANVEVDEHFAAMSGEVTPGAYIQLSVVDSGVGIPREELARIFDPFFTTKEVGKGTGLGLSTVAAIVRSHGGFVNVYSEVGSGSTFRFYLPATLEGEGEGPALGSVKLPRGGGELILVVDDESAVLVVTRQTLEAFGYRVITATDGADAVATYARLGDRIALVLTDIMMPIMDGPAAIRALTRMNPEIRIIAASGLGAEGGGTRSSEIGARHFLPKPYTASALLTSIRRVLDEPE